MCNMRNDTKKRPIKPIHRHLSPYQQNIQLCTPQTIKEKKSLTLKKKLNRICQSNSFVGYLALSWKSHA